MLVAVTVIPTFIARLNFDTGFSAEGARERLRKRIVITLAGSLAIILLLTPPAEYLPEGEEPKALASMNAPPGYNLKTMQVYADE
tara:strand:+ start:1026 stop:1280 length:255 start_codon:yes stop_codon:yes gene_type:complete